MAGCRAHCCIEKQDDSWGVSIRRHRLGGGRRCVEELARCLEELSRCLEELSRRLEELSL